MKVTSVISLILVMFSIIGCDGFARRTEKRIRDDIKTAESELDDEVRKVRKKFLVQSEKARANSPDSLRRSAIDDLKLSITSTDFYLDSMRGEMKQLDIMDARTVDKVATTFLYRGVGDSIYYKLKRSFSLATSAVRNKQQRDAITTASDSLIGDLSSINWKNKYFGLTGSFAANAILYSFQTELFNIGTTAVTP